MMLQDVRYSARMLRKTPTFTIGAVLTLALAIGANTAIFSVVHGVLLRQLPFAHPERILWVWSNRIDRDRSTFNVPDFIDYREQNRTFDQFAGFFAFNANLSDESAAERVQGVRASGSLFSVLGVGAELGRALVPDDERPGADHVVVLTRDFWQRRFGADPDIIG